MPDRFTREEAINYESSVPRIVASCEAGDLSACIKAGEASEAERFQRYLEGKAEYFYAKACDGGNRDGCAFLAARKLWFWTTSGKSMVGLKDPEMTRARRKLIRLCENGVAVSCYFLASASTSDNYDERQRWTLDHYKRACDLGEAKGCFQAGQELPEPVTHDNPKTTAEWVRLQDRGCSMGGLLSCNLLGNYFRVGGPGEGPDYPAALHYLNQACDAGFSMSCESLGDMYHVGKGVKQDLQRAREIFERLCSNDDKAGCYQLGMMYRDGDGTAANLANAFNAFKRCAQWDNRCMVPYGVIMIENDGLFGDPAFGVGYLRDVCHRETPAGCLELGRLALGNPWIGQVLSESSLTMLELDCKNSIREDGCILLALAKMNGISCEKDEQNAREILKRNCERSSVYRVKSEACLRLEKNDFSMPKLPVIKDPRPPLLPASPPPPPSPGRAAEAG